MPNDIQSVADLHKKLDAMNEPRTGEPMQLAGTPIEGINQSLNEEAKESTYNT